MISSISVATPPAHAAPAPAPLAPAAPVDHKRFVGMTAEQVGPQLVGMAIADARAAVEQLDMGVRVTILDGEPQVVTMDYDPQRINVAVEGETITGFDGLG